MKDSNTRRLLRAGRNEDSEIALGGYEDEGGAPKPLTGDESALFVKVPPFVVKPETYWDNVVLPDVNDDEDYLIGSTIDVSRWSLITAYISTRDLGDVAQLSLVPEAGFAVETSADTEFYPLAVINPVIATVNVEGHQYGSRNMYMTELRTALSIGSNFRAALPFDVRTFNSFRFRAANLQNGEGPSRITLKYILSM